MVETTAILALNSLDRYLTNQKNEIYTFNATWASGVNVLTFNTITSLTTPIVGSLLASYSFGDGIPEGTTITAWDPTTNIITISNNTTQAQPNPFPVFWVNTITVGYYSDALRQQYLDSTINPCNNFIIPSGTSLIYGYITKIIVSQIQLQYNIPTINRDLNDTFYLYSSTPGLVDYYKIVIPHGFYYADELAALLQSIIRATRGELQSQPPIGDMEVVFNPRDGFTFSSVLRSFSFPSPDETFNRLLVDPITSYKTLKLLGMGITNATTGNSQTSFDYPNFLYTPYIDIYSDTLTNYQKVKDTNTSIIAPKGLIARLYVSGTGQIQITGSTSALGTAPFVMTSDLNSPKVINWTPDVSVTSIDIQLRDCYGDLIPGYQDGFSTEFQMTLLCTEE
jgi:hypothetical protein